MKNTNTTQSMEERLEQLCKYKMTIFHEGHLCINIPDVLDFIRSEIASARKQAIQECVGVCEGEKMTPTKHEGCRLDDGFCYDHGDIMEERDYPNGAHSVNDALDRIITNLKEKI